MARNVRDLRDLICVSRLTIRDSDEELSDNDFDLPTSFDSLNLDSRPGTALIFKGDRYLPNGTKYQPRPPAPASSGARPKSTGARPKNRSGKTNNTTSIGDTSRGVPHVPSLSRGEWPHTKEPLPPVGSRPSSSSSTNSDLSRQGSGTRRQGDFDEMLEFLDPNAVGQWLKRANEMVSELSMWCYSADNFVKFAHFWMTEFPDTQRDNIFTLEVSILHDEFTMAFAEGIRTGKVRESDLSNLQSAVFKEYPSKLTSAKGAHLFLDILDILSSERNAEYKKLLSDVKISTRNKEFAQMMLATRSFALLNVWYAVVNFYRNVKSRGTVGGDVSDNAVNKTQKEDTLTVTRAFQATQYGYSEVLYYLMKSQRVSPLVKDSSNRTLMFTAVMYNQPVILSFLLTKVQPRADVNEPADTGNTPLHAAANLGYDTVVKTLVQKGHANPNVVNPQCENATPLHLAVMHGHTEVCQALVIGGADVNAKMGDFTPIQMASDMEQQEILQILTSTLEGATGLSMESD
ncbi:uncharacterized protein LOC144435256 [Glandiceps talaboti]